MKRLDMAKLAGNYLIAPLLGVGAMSLIASLDGAPIRGLFLYAIGAVIITTLIGGRGPGLLCVVFCVLCSSYYFLEPKNSFLIYGYSNLVRLSIFSILSTTLILIISRLQRSSDELKKLNLELENRIDERTKYLREANHALEDTNRILIVEIAQRQEAEEVAKQHEEELIRSNVELERFAYMSSHDLKEPLRMITNYSQLLSRKLNDRIDQDCQDYLHQVIDASKRMNELIRDVLAYCEIGSTHKRWKQADCNLLFQRVLQNLSLSIHETRAHVTADPLPLLYVNEVEILQLFQNLVSNALKFHGERPPRVHLSCKREKGDWLFSVRDNGIGIDSSYQQRIFEIFQRLHTRTEYPGTGIGLAICKKVVENHGGKIWVESITNEGATFFFTLNSEKVSPAHFDAPHPMPRKLSDTDVEALIIKQAC
jgi:signal transduction histidine kinase